jgi:hypothetical protein
VSFVLAASSCQALAEKIELQIMQGEVLVDAGFGMTAVSGTVELVEGNRVVLRENSAAMLTYTEQQCFTRLEPAAVVNITADAPCASDSFASVSKGAVIVPANGVYVPADLASAPAGSTSTLIAGGAFIAAVGATFVFNQVTRSEKSPTPLSTY